MLLFTGAVAGFLSGLFGIGGGICVVPLLAIAFNRLGFSIFAMHMAVSTSLAIMIFTTGSSFLAHRHQQKGGSIWPTYRQLSPGIVLGVILGAILAHAADAYVLRFVFALVVLLMAMKMVFVKPYSHRDALPALLWMCLVGFVIGLKSGMLGLGGGVIVIPFLVYFGVPMRQAVVVSSATSLTIASLGSVAFLLLGHGMQGLPQWSLGYIYLPAVLVVAPMSILFARVGAFYSYRLSAVLLKRGLCALMLVISAHMFLQ